MRFHLKLFCLVSFDTWLGYCSNAALTSMRVHPVDGVILRVQRVLQVELCVLQDPLDNVLDIHGLWHPI